MTDESRLQNIEQKLDKISETLQQIAVQQEQINTHGRELIELKRGCYDMDKKVNCVKQFQASCPRGQIKFLWWFTGTVNISVLIALLILVIH